MSEFDNGEGVFGTGLEEYMNGWLPLAEQALHQANVKLGAGADGIWEIHDPETAPDCLLSCPHGNVIEQDGTCPSGCVSPLLGAGLA